MTNEALAIDRCAQMLQFMLIRDQLREERIRHERALEINAKCLRGIESEMRELNTTILREFCAKELAK